MPIKVDIATLPFGRVIYCMGCAKLCNIGEVVSISTTNDLCGTWNINLCESCLTELLELLIEDE